MARNVSVTLALVDRISQKLDDIANSADRALAKFMDLGDRMDQTFERATSRAERMSESVQQSMTVTENYAEQSSRATQVIEEQAESMDRSSQVLEEQTSAVNNAAQALEEHAASTDTATQALEQHTDSADDVIRSMEEQAESADRAAREIDEYGEQAEESGERAGQAAMDLGDALVAAGIAVALGQIWDAYNACDEAADNFETAMAKVSTIADTQAKSLDTIQGEIQDLSKETGVSVTDLSEAVYSAISASVDTADAVEFVAQANALAVGGFTSTTTAVDILTTALNAYGLEASETQNIADMLINTQNLGKTTVDELASSMGKIIPTAKSLNVSLDVLCGSYAVMTSNGIATAETTTYMNSMLNELGKNGTSAAEALRAGTEEIKAGGMTMAEAMESGMSLTDVLAILDEQARESGTSINNMFGSAEAGKAANVLWGNAQKVDKAIEQMGNSAGAANTAFEQMASTGEYVDQKFQNSLDNLKIAIGNAQPSLDGLMEKGTEIINKLTEFVENNPEVVQAIEGAAVALGIFTVAMGVHTAATLIAEKATLALTAAMDTNPFFLVASAIAAVVAGIVVFVGSVSNAEEAEDRLTGSSQLLSNEIERQEKVVDELKEKYGEHNEKTLEAQARLNELRAEYEETAMTIEAFDEQISNTIDSFHESTAEYEKTSAELEDQAFYAQSLVTELQKLQSQSELTAFEQQYEKKVVAELNELYPELGLSYDEATRKLGKSTEYLKKYCDQKSEERKLDADTEQYAEYLSQKSILTEQLTQAQQDLTDATSEYNRLSNELASTNLMTLPEAEYDKYVNGMGDAQYAMEAAQSQVNELDAALNELQAEMDALGENASKAATGINGVGDASGNVISTTADLKVAMEGIFTNVQEQAEKLSQAYKDAYAAAADAVDSSFGFFEKIELKSEQSTEAMIAAWQTQEEYLLEYAANIEKAKELGLDDSLVEKLADGSQESAAALDTIIGKIESLGESTDAAKDYVSKMNESFSGVQEAKQVLEDAMVSANTSLQTQMAELKTTMDTGVNNLNLSGAAKTSAYETINAYISQIISMAPSAADAAASVKLAAENALKGTQVNNYNLAYQSAMYTKMGVVDGVMASYPAVEKVYSGLGTAGYAAFNRSVEINSPSKKFKESGKYTVEGAIEGVEENKQRLEETFEDLAGTALDRYQSKISEVGAATGEYLNTVTEKFGAHSEETATAVDFISGKLNELAESYQKNFDSAYQSIDGQLGLFNDVEFGTSKNIDEMIESLKKQTDYMAEYGAYMVKAMEMGVDEGILEKLSDGSKESGAILKEIVTNGSEKIDELNANFAKVEQGKETFAAAMAELKTYYGTALDGMVSDIQSAAEKMNQHDKAFSSAEDTCQGIIDGVDAKWDEVISKFSSLSEAAEKAFAPTFNTTPSVPGHANGTTYGENVYLAGEEGPELIVGRRGSEVFPASETAKILSAVMANKDSDINRAPQEIINTLVQESKSTNTENKNMTLTINGKGSFGVEKGVSRKEVLNCLRDEIEGVLMNIISNELYEEGEYAHDF